MAAANTHMTDTTTIKIEEEVKHTLTPPASDEGNKNGDTSSELSEPPTEEEDDIGEIEPDHYWDGGRVPVFKPTMHQFKSFKKFVDKIDKYGMKAGIVKVIPPTEWTDSLPSLEEQVKSIRVKNPISQEFNGTQGKFTQANMEKQRTYNLPQWKALTEDSSHQPPAKRGERRRVQDKPTRSATTRSQRKSIPLPLPEGQKRKPGRPRTRPIPSGAQKESTPVKVEGDTGSIEGPPTPVSPSLRPATSDKPSAEDQSGTAAKTRGRQPKSVSSRRKNNSTEAIDEIDEEAFEGFDYHLDNLEEWTKERCQELETSYWKSLNFNNPMYGADMPGSLFDDNTESWNVAKLENLLDVLGTKVPGVNTAYLYLGMWKATFAWHLEDVDLYSINYIHFGAPKQWYSISQEDARRFESAMKSLWPQDAKNCDQFLRHKTYLISPQVLKSQFNIEVNRLVHYEGEFVITFPYGYHSGYNIGYNCAESVNFATESWLEFGKIAKKCNCEADSVWVDVYDIERKLRGEPTPEYEEYYEYEEDEEDEVVDLPTPPGSEKDAAKPRKRKADSRDSKPTIKRLRLSAPKLPKAPCVLCPNDWPYEELLPTAEGKQMHKICATYIPETFVDDSTGTEVIHGFSSIDKQRFGLNCLYCRRKNIGACFQCNQPKCPRSYHATCAASAGVAVEIGLQARYDEQGTEYSDVGIDLRCRFHRPKRAKHADALACSEALEESEVVRKYAAGLQAGESVQFQFHKGDILAGYVIENREDESTILLDLVPHRRTIEVDHKYVLPFDKAHSQLTAPSENAKPLPAHLARRSQTTNEDPTNDNPKPDDFFNDPKYNHKWADYRVENIAKNPDQKPVDLLNKPQSLAYYLGKTSTEAKPQYTEDPALQRNNVSLNFLEIVRALAPPPHPAADTIATTSSSAAVGRSNTTATIPISTAQKKQQQQQQQQQQARQRVSLPAAYPAQVRVHAPSAQRTNLKPSSVPRQATVPGSLKHERTAENSTRPYKGKYAIGTEPTILKGGRVDPQALRNQQAFLQSSQQHANAHAHAHPPTNFARYHQLSQQHHHSPSTGMRPGTNMQNMADIRRRQSNPPPPLNMEQVQRMQWQQTSRPVSQHQHGSRPSSSQQHAPVANMMGSNSPAAQSTFSRSTTSQITPPSTAHSSVGSRSRSDSVKALAKYPYLHLAAMARPQVYQSPYGPPGVITDAYLPIPKVISVPVMRPRGKSLTQNFLDCATPSQRDSLKGHVRTISVEKAMLRAQESDRRKLESLQRLRANMGPPTQPLSPSFGNSFTHDLFPDRNFSDSPFSPDFNGNTFQTNTDFSNYFHTFQPQPHIHYSSPQAFQQQVRQEEHNLRHKPNMMSHGRNSYGAMKNLNTNLANMHAHAHGAQDVMVGSNGQNHHHHHSNTQGSPIRTGRDGVGTATLPMMDPSSF